MSKGDKDILLIKVHALASDGAGVARSGNLVVFVRGVLPGETARVLVTERRKKFWRGELLELIPPKQGDEGSRRLPTCPVFGCCGGCDLQHMSYEATLSWKKQWVMDAIARIAKVKVPVNDVAGMKEPWRYRNKATLHWDGLSLGWYSAQTHEVVEFTDCFLLSQGMNETVKRLKSYLSACSADPMSIILRQDTAGKVWLVHSDGMGQEILAQFDWDEEGLGSGEGPDAILAGEREEHLTYQVDGLSIIVSLKAFLQVNSEQIHTLLQTVTKMADLKGRETVWDLYCGVGVLGLALARNARAVVGIEENAQAVRDAYLNARLNGVGNICFIAGKTEDILDSDLACQANRLEIVKVPPDFVAQAASVQRPDLIVVDPPRAGLSHCVLESIRQLQPVTILYVSCDPSTLARDVGRLVHGGDNRTNSSEKTVYEVTGIQPIDMFPWTRHVETVVLLSKLKSTNSIEVKIDLDEMDLTTAESKATYDEIKQYVLDKYGFKVSQLYIAQVKRKNGIIERENYNTGDGKAKVPQVSLEKEKAIEDALRYFKMIR